MTWKPERLELARTKAGLSYQKLATAAGITKAHAWELCKGRSANPSVDMVEALAKAVKTKPEWLVGWYNNPLFEMLLASVKEVESSAVERAKGEGL